MTTTTQLRSWWAPACTGPFAKVALHGAGVVSVRPAIGHAVHALNAALIHHDYRTRAADTGAYNCRRITGGTGYSLHAYGTALDLNWQTNPYGPRLITDMPAPMVAAIKAVRTRNGKQVWRWGGDYAGNKDAMHFEIVCHPSDLAAGIDPTTVAGYAPPSSSQEYDMDFLDLSTVTFDEATWFTGRHVDNLKALMIPVLAAGGRGDLIMPLLPMPYPIPTTRADIHTRAAFKACQDILRFVGALHADRSDEKCGPASWRALIEF